MQVEKSILLIDSDLEYLEINQSTFKKEGYHVSIANNATEAIQIANKVIPNIILLEVMVPGKDGIEICYELRNTTTLHKSLIVFYTSRNEDYSQIAAFNAGADDYIIKPIRANVLLSRVKALSKRLIYSTENKTSTTNNILIDRDRYLVVKDGLELYLPRKEFELFSLLYLSPKKVFTRRDIYSLIWGQNFSAHGRTIDVHIRKLREKIGSNRIKTIKGVGYCFE